MVASIVGIIFSLAMCALFFSYFFRVISNSHLLRIGTLIASVDIEVAEHIIIWIIWIFFLITAALVTVCFDFLHSVPSLRLLQRQFSNLKWCRSHHKVCSVLETIKAFGWICWGLLTILLVLTLIALILRSENTNRGNNAPATYETRQTGPATVHDQSRTTQPAQGVPATHGAQTTKQGIQQQSHPTTTTAPGALYQQDIDHPTVTEPRNIV
jgi:hypothetical protein